MPEEFWKFYKKPLHLEVTIRALVVDKKKEYGRMANYRQKRVDEFKRSLIAISPNEPVTVSARQSPGT